MSHAARQLIGCSCIAVGDEHGEDPELASAIAASLAGSEPWEAGGSSWSSRGPLEELRPSVEDEQGEAQVSSSAGQEPAGRKGAAAALGMDGGVNDNDAQDPALAAAIAASLEDMQQSTSITDEAAAKGPSSSRDVAEPSSDVVATTKVHGCSILLHFTALHWCCW